MPVTLNDATVFLVDDEATVRRAVSRVVSGAGYTVRAFASPLEFLRTELPPGPACVLMDMEMEEMSGLQVQAALQSNPRRIPVVFLSGHGTIPTAMATVKQGADDFLEKPARAKDLLAAIGRAIEKDRQASTRRHASDDLMSRYNRLTLREREVMALVVTGLLNKQAAGELGISEKTIKVHRARVMEKMQIKSLAELVRLAGHLPIEMPAISTATGVR